MYDDEDEMILVDADFEIIKKLTNKINILDKNLEKLIDNNKEFIEKMINKENTEKTEKLNENIENNIDNIREMLYNMKLQELKNICKDNHLKKYSNMNKNILVEYIINNIDLEKLK